MIAEPQICENHYDYLMKNGTAFKYFICPLDGQPDGHTYCCGPKRREKCCGFWDE